MTEANEGRVFVVGAVTGRGKGSGVETTQRFWSVLWLKNELIVRRQVFLDEAMARTVAGLE